MRLVVAMVRKAHAGPALGAARVLRGFWVRQSVFADVSFNSVAAPVVALIEEHIRRGEFPLSGPRSKRVLGNGNGAFRQGDGGNTE